MFVMIVTGFPHFVGFILFYFIFIDFVIAELFVDSV